MYGSAWVITGWTIVGGTVFLFGFLFFYDLDFVKPPTSTTSPISTTPLTMTSGVASSMSMATFTVQSNASLQMTSSLSTTNQAVTRMEPTTAEPPPSFTQCGVRSDGLVARVAQPLLGSFLVRLLEGRIIGGTTAVSGEWPWISYLYELQNGPVNGGICGGTLVSERWVISAAHCIGTNIPSLYGVILGAHRISQPSGFEQNRTVNRIEIHPLYDTVTFNYDVALIELSEPVRFNEFIRPICFVPPGTRTDNDSPPSFAGSVCSTLGWGFTSSPGGQRSDVLMQLNLVITPETLCQITTISNAADYGNRPVTEGSPKFCAGGQLNEDTCNGDSGGPLVCLHDDGMYYLHGITSYGTDICGQANKPGVYTEVSNEEIENFVNGFVTF